MLARYLLVFLAVEALIYILIAIPLAITMAPAAIALLIIAIAIAVHTLPVFLSFALAWWHRTPRSPEMRLGIRGTLALLLGEATVTLLLYTVAQPFERWFNRPAPEPPQTTGGPVVLFIHGFFENGAVWCAMRRFLLRRNVQAIFTLNLEPVFGDIEEYVPRIDARICEICAATGVSEVVLVCHSMGGLAARAYLRQFPDQHRIARVVTLGTPHHGTEHARLLGAPNARQMQPEDAWLAQLNAAQAETGVPITSIFSVHDNIVAPQENSILESARNIPLAGIGHQALMFSKRVSEMVYREVVSSGGSDSHAGSAHAETGSAA